MHRAPAVHARDVQQQKLLVDARGHLVVAEDLLLEDGWAGAARNRHCQEYQDGSRIDVSA
jgi:hypothetical protein